MNTTEKNYLILSFLTDEEIVEKHRKLNYGAVMDFHTNIKGLFKVLEKILSLTAKKYGNEYYPFKVKLSQNSVVINKQDYFGDVVYKAISNEKTSLLINLYNVIIKLLQDEMVEKN